MHTIEGYQVIQKIGTGASSEVYMGKHNSTGTMVAIKILKAELLSRESVCAHEIEVHRAIKHPLVATIYEVRQMSDNVAIIMENVGSCSLLDYINANGPIQAPLCQKILAQIVSILHYCHHIAHCVHRDLKPENIMLDKKLNARLIDFGFSRQITENMMTTRCGSICYIAPEILMSQEYTESVDIWSLGVVLYSMLVQALPFPGNNDSQIMSNILNSEPVFPHYVPEQAQDLIGRMLDKNPKTRITLNDIISHQWFSYPDYIRIGELDIDQYIAQCGALDVNVIQQLESNGLPTDNLQKFLAANVDNVQAVHYRMIYKAKANRAMSYAAAQTLSTVLSFTGLQPRSPLGKRKMGHNRRRLNSCCFLSHP